MKLVFSVIFSLFIHNTLAQGAAPKKNKNFFEETKTSIKNPFELRDPFKRSKIRLRKKRRTYGGFLDGNSYSNVSTIDGLQVEEIRVVGVLLGKDRRAIAKTIKDEALSKETYILKEGMKIGENKAEIKAIVPGGIILVEKIVNVYDQEEYIETIIPVSTDVE